MDKATDGQAGSLGPWAQGLIWALALPGLALLAYGLLQIYRDLDLLVTGERTKGVVVKHEFSRSDGQLIYHPVVRFRISQAEALTFTSEAGSSEKYYDRGETVTVLYKPEAPNEAEALGMLFLRISVGFVLHFGFAVLLILPVVGYYGFGAGGLLWKRQLLPERAPALGPD